MKPLDYKNALITGASSGLGRGLTLWLAKRGIRIHACARRLDQLEKLARLLKDSFLHSTRGL